ncbi:30S ribosomal protein S20 [Candidatus Aerophobetes bacterium]|nr:30S ribosomal protein S20 [Candidatus Aerophobetes bacterium]
MPIIKSSKKSMKKDRQRREYNRSIKNETKTGIKKINELINQKKEEEAKKILPHIISLIDNTAQKGVWHKNKVAREKSKLMKKISFK